MSKGREAHQARLNQVSSFGKDLARRCKSCCELCGENTNLEIYEIPPVSDPDIDKCVMICEACKDQIENPSKIDINHWHCLNETAWTEIPAVQVLVWRLLGHLSTERWAQDLKDQLYLDDDIVDWAESI